MALIKTLNSERFAALPKRALKNANAILTGRDRFRLVPALFLGRNSNLENIKFYEVDEAYIDYLSPMAPHLFLNKKPGQQNSRKYIGIVLTVHGMNFFAPLSSFKDKHSRIPDGLDFIKVKHYAVINLNNMFPIPDGVYTYVDISKEKNPQYKSLLLAEYRFIKSIQEKIRKNAVTLYNHKKDNGNSTALAKRCNDFILLEEASKKYKRK